MLKNNNDHFFKYFQELVEHSSKIYFAYHVEKNEFSYLNAAFEQMWHKSIESVGHDPKQLFSTVHPEDRDFLIKNFQQLLLNPGLEKDFEFRILVDDGDIKWLLINPVLLKETNEKIIIGTVDDITKVKDHYAVMEKFAAKKNSILEILSHDLAGPLNNINGISTLLADELKAYNNPNIDKMIGMITKTSARSIQLIREFVKQEFMESANSSSVKKRVDIVRKVKESMDQYKSSEENVGKTFHFTSSHKEIFMELDDYKFLQVINNLISNSIKFTHDDGVISVSIEDHPEKVLFVVTDNGVGIPEKFHDKLFEKFTKARRPGLKGEPSTGLGMSIIKTIVDWHGGSIWFESKEGVGTTFYIELPKE